jgi:hypothetical protein
VIPNNLLGLLVFAASLGPGYVFIRVAERHRVRPGRTTLLEVAELVSVGAFASAVALLVGLFAADWTGWLDLEALSGDTGAYLRAHPERSLSFALAVLLASYAGTWIVAKALHRRIPASIRLHSMWDEALSDDNGGRNVYATIELRDQRSIFGFVSFFTVGDNLPPDQRELALAQPLKARSSGRSSWVALNDDRVIIRASDIVALGVQYVRP